MKDMTAVKEMWPWAERKPPKSSTTGSNQGSFINEIKKNQAALAGVARWMSTGI